MLNAIAESLFLRNQEHAADLSDTDDFLAAFVGALGKSVVSHACCPPHAEFLGISARISSGNRLANLTEENLDDNCWMHANSPGAAADAFSRVVSKWAIIVFLSIFRQL